MPIRTPPPSALPITTPARDQHVNQAPVNHARANQVPAKPEVGANESAANTTLPNTPTGVMASDLAGLARRGQNGATGVGQLQTRGFEAQTNLFGLEPGRLQNAVGLDVVLAQIAKDPKGPALVQSVIATIEAETGVSVPPALVSAAMANPERLADVMRLTPAQMSAGMEALSQAHTAGQVPATPARSQLLAQRFDFKDMGAIKFERAQTTPKEVAPGIFRGGFTNPAVDDVQAKMNTVVAEVFDRLAGNSDLPAKDRFSATFEGRTFTRVDTFADHLTSLGYAVTATSEHRVANFAELLTQAPNGALLDVPAPLMVDVDLGNGKKVAVPSIHSELVFSIEPPTNDKTPTIPGAKIKWYQGVSATGFFPSDLGKTPEWTGNTVTDTFTGTDAMDALKLSGLMGDVINQASKDQGLLASGYGLTGVCNDSVAVIEMALTGRATTYPLLMQDKLLTPELNARMSDQNHRDDPSYKLLLNTIEKLPSDVVANPSMLERALLSLPWKSGEEPFSSTIAARTAIEDAIATS